MGRSPILRAMRVGLLTLNHTASADREGRPPAIVRFAPIASAGVLLVAMIALSRSFGATWDERDLQAYGEQIWNFYSGRMPRSEINLTVGQIQIYGGFVEFLDVAVQHVIHADAYVVRHAVNSVFGWVGIVYAFLLARRLVGTL